MKLEKSVERQTKNTVEYYKNLDNLEEVPIDILRLMYIDLLQNSIPKQKIEDKIKELKDKIKQNEKELRKKPEPVGSGFGSFDEYFKWRYKVIHENELLKEEIKDIQELLEVN